MISVVIMLFTLLPEVCTMRKKMTLSKTKLVSKFDSKIKRNLLKYKEKFTRHLHASFETLRSTTSKLEESASKLACRCLSVKTC